MVLKGDENGAILRPNITNPLLLITSERILDHLHPRFDVEVRGIESSGPAGVIHGNRNDPRALESVEAVVRGRRG